MASETQSGTTGRGARGESDVARNTAELQEQIETLKGDIGSLSNTLADLLKSGVREGRATLRKRAKEYQRQGEEQAGAAMDSAKEYGEALEERIVQSPFTAVLVALGMGFLIGLMSRR